MTIKEIFEENLEQTCEACGHERPLNLDDLNVGIAVEGQVNPNVVPMPPCESCGAVELLIPSNEGAPDHPSPGSLGHRHAMLVDILCERLVTRGRVIAEVDTGKLKKKKHAKVEIDQWFKDGLKLARPKPSEPVDDKQTKKDEEAPIAE